jgi:hypothetical protein
VCGFGTYFHVPNGLLPLASRPEVEPAATCQRQPIVALQITYQDPARLKPRAKNPRAHTAKQIKQIAASIKEFGFINPILIDGDGGIIAGHGRVEAAKLIGMGDVPTVRVDHLTPAQIRAYVIADNRLAENAGWDRELLALELQELSVDLNFDVTVTGFETAEIDLLIGELNERIEAATKPYSELKNLCVWSKSNAGMGSLYRSQHELVFPFKKGTAAHVNNVELGRFGRNRTNVWHYPGVNTFGKDRDTELAMHPTVKPVALVADAILDCSKRGGLVLDAFAGSGTSLIAAEKTGRRGYQASSRGGENAEIVQRSLSL